ncbi:NTP transferase domain-containing protein [Marinobacter nauticus]|uniref:nucleotidyltransferase family protein n=1 Tax=Marinobacter nauticus TaxID=2743 RepID=UPI0022A6B26C|nr:nucleotidyltransferase family protein [Marinobacter nauticus]
MVHGGSGVVRLHDGGILAKIAAFSSFRGRIINANHSSKDPQFPALVLAAGQARRMGRYKQVLKLPDGGSLLGHAIGQARQLSAQTWVVAGAGYPLVRFRCDRQPARWVVNERWREGLSTSLIAGLQALSPAALGVFVVLADQPLLDREGLRRLSANARRQPDAPWAASYGKRVGVPAWIPKALWEDLLSLEGDAGAGAVLNRAGACPVDIAGVQQDVDTPQDWQLVRGQLAEQAG